MNINSQSKALRGFTLIELLVVIAIIGILSSIVLASLSGARAKGRDARRISDIKQLQLALELYYDANSAYPTSIGSGTTGPLASNGYISVIPSDPSNSATSYFYTPYALSGNASTCTSYHLGATLEVNGTTGPLATDSDISAPPSGYVICTASGSPASDFAGTDPVYDVTP